MNSYNSADSKKHRDIIASNYKRTKIVATIGPSSSSETVLKSLIKAGLDVVRLNFSHGTYEERIEQIKLIRNLSKELGKPVAIMADLQGPKLRLGKFEGIIQIKKGDAFILSTNPEGGELPIQFDLSPYVSKNERIFINDGLLEFTITEVKNDKIKIKAENNGIISANKGVNIPDTTLKNAAFTKKDAADAEFVLGQDIDLIALSFVQSASDLAPLKELIKKHNSNTKIVAKIEKKAAIDNLEEIIKEADGVMVARGDLGIETKASEVPIVQEKIINMARQYQKPVIVATQMLESMIYNPRPTRAETSDVANAVLKTADAVMLSAESANGKYPVEAVSTMADIITSVEAHPEYINDIEINWHNINAQQIAVNAFASSAADLSFRIGAKVIAVGSVTGKTARVLASFRPKSKILAITHDEKNRNQLQLSWGVESIVIPSSKSHTLFWNKIAKEVLSRKLANHGDKIVILSGSLIGVAGRTDTIKVVTL